MFTKFVQTSLVSKRESLHHRYLTTVLVNQAQYDTAKDNILDLLGWGVTPEYLVDLGLSRELLYYIFTELNLRLPDNLDTTGLHPYNPDTLKAFSFIEPDLSIREGTHSSADDDVKTPLSTNPQTVALSADHLDDVEQQRRQELIARKAVQASRRQKRSAVASVVGNDASTSRVPPPAIDDFLNKTLTLPGIDKVADPQSATFDTDATPIPPTPPVPTQPHPVLLADPPISTPSAPPPSSDNSIVTTLDHTLRKSKSPEDTPAPPLMSRRGMKRPVASDFVDFDIPPTPPDPHEFDPLRNPNVYQPIRRKTGISSFVTVRPAKCVINLSDSESDDDERDALAQAPAPPPAPSSKAPAPRQIPPINAKKLAELAATEKAIEDMRRKIAQMEEEKRKKKHAVCHLVQGLVWQQTLMRHLVETFNWCHEAIRAFRPDCCTAKSILLPHFPAAGNLNYLSKCGNMSVLLALQEPVFFFLYSLRSAPSRKPGMCSLYSVDILLVPEIRPNRCDPLVKYVSIVLLRACPELTASSLRERLQQSGKIHSSSKMTPALIACVIFMACFSKQGSPSPPSPQIPNNVDVDTETSSSTQVRFLPGDLASRAMLDNAH